MKKLLTIILITLATSVFAQDTLATYTKIYNFGKPNRETWKCYVIQNRNKIDTVCIKQGEGQSQRDNQVIPISRITEDSTMIILKQKIETDYQKDLKSFQELQTKIIKEESYLEILNYLIEEKKK